MTKGYFFIDRVWPEEKPLVDTVRQALSTKVGKLASTEANRRILLLEKDIPVGSDAQVGKLIDRLQPEFPKLRSISQAWIVNTVALESEDYVSIDLVWPTDDALERDYARDAGV